MKYFEKVVLRLVNWGAVAAGLFLVVIMVAIVLDVVLRLLRIPFVGSYEIAEAFIIVTVAFALPFAAVKGTHVVIDVLITHFGRRKRAISTAIALFLTLVIWGLIVWASFNVMLAKWTNEFSFTLNIPYLPFRIIWVIGLILFCLVYITEIAKRIKLIGESK
jgi:TRAP-type C4-dicarboxylate transport system permease small subunit